MSRRPRNSEALSRQIHSRRGQMDARHPTSSLAEQLGVIPIRWVASSRRYRIA
jgi:hypothetical protein